MKKILAIVLCVTIIFSFAACGGEKGNEIQNSAEQNFSESGTDNIESNEENKIQAQPNAQTNSSQKEPQENKPQENEVFAPPMVFSKSGGVKEVNSLSNTYNKLKNNKILTIGYTGGSVTDGSGGTDGYCWRTATTDWFKTNFPECEITEVDGSKGNKSSLWGFFRIDDWVKSGQKSSLIDAKPDLVFLEFAINDYYVRMTKERTIHYMEGMINKIRNALPETDIVIVFITDEGHIASEVPTLPYQEELAQFYGIPTINVGERMKEHLAKSGEEFKEYYVDNVHPNDKGYSLYAEWICEFLKERLITNPSKETEIKPCVMPQGFLLSGCSVDSEIIPAHKILGTAKSEGFKVLDVPGNAVKEFGPQVYGSLYSEMEFEFEGTGISLMVDAPTSALLKCTIDDTEHVSASVANGIHNELFIVNNLKSGKHKIKIRIVGGKRFIFGAFLIEK